jgi:diguanylate cyclase (GGDEF)-like protein
MLSKDDPKLQILQGQLQTAPDIPARIEAFTELASHLFHCGDLHQVDDLCEQALGLAQTLGPDGESYQIYSIGPLIVKGNLYLDNGELQQAKSLYEQVLNLYTSETPTRWYGYALSGLSWIELLSNNLPEARLLADKAMQVADQLPGEYELMCDCLNTLGAVYDESGFFEPAISCYKKSLEIARQHSALRSQVISLNNIAMSYVSFERAQEALPMLPEMQALAKQLDYEHNNLIGDTIGQIYLALKDYPTAITYFKQVIADSNKTGYEKRDIESYIHLSKVLIETGQLDEATQYALYAFQIAQQINYAMALSDVHELLARLYELKGDYRLALEHHKQFHSLSESKFSRDTLQKISDLTVSFQVEASRKDAEILRLKNLTLLQELEDHKRNFEELEKQAKTDPLTGLLNRRSFYELVNQQCEFARRNHKPLALILLDIDHFKAINDLYGHLAGDQLLVEFAKLLYASTRKMDVCCRYGGEEFIALLPIADNKEAWQVAERFRRALAETTLKINGRDVKITVSAGIAQFLPEDTLEDLLARADNALYISKRAGRNRISA